MEYFLKHQKMILRIAGAVMLVVGLSLYFWAAPEKGLSENEKAAANLARMEAATQGGASKSVKTQPPSHKIAASLRETRKQQLRTLMLMVIALGGGFLVFSFLRKEE